MRSERGQGTVEYVGIVLLVAVLLGAVAGGFGVPQLTAGIATSITRAFLGATGIVASAQQLAYARPSAADRAAFARASDVSLAPDDRPSLRDVRLSLIARYGDERGRTVYRQLIIDDLEQAVPALTSPTVFATATPGVRQPGVMQRYLPINSDLSLRAPVGSDAGEVERRVSRPNAHVVTVSEADAALDHALHPGTSLTGVALDLMGVLPIGRLAGGVVKTVRATARLTKGVRALARIPGAAANGVTLIEDVAVAEAPSSSASPPGSREGDEVVTWLASRCPMHGDAAPPREFMRTAVVRDGTVILDSIAWPPDGTPRSHSDSHPNEGCS